MVKCKQLNIVYPTFDRPKKRSGLIAAPFFLFVYKENKMELTPQQVMFLGFVASVVTLALRILATRFNYKPGRLVVNVGLFLVSAVLAVAWTKPALPPFTEDIGAFISALFLLAAPVVGFATLIYNALYSQVVVPTFARFAKK